MSGKQDKGNRLLPVRCSAWLGQVIISIGALTICSLMIQSKCPPRHLASELAKRAPTNLQHLVHQKSSLQNVPPQKNAKISKQRPDVA
jgi:hypothetical protein